MTLPYCKTLLTINNNNNKRFRLVYLYVTHICNKQRDSPKMTKIDKKLTKIDKEMTKIEK